MKIIIDAMGGDNAPLEIVKGALAAQKRWDVEVALTGDTVAILKALESCGVKELPHGLEIVHTTETVEMCDDPATVFRRKKDSSMGVALQMLRDGKGDAAVSAGSTGALLTGATLIVKRVRGIRRAAMAPVIPTTTGKAVLIDCGANAECTPGVSRTRAARCALVLIPAPCAKARIPSLLMVRPILLNVIVIVMSSITSIVRNSRTKVWLLPARSPMTAS